ncbi:sialic acid-binding Ig-like lectin 14 isoform X2 [Corythoichthys intestinalis]|uniref:sialic acid-binding Ig-like lectin 14 isoform X2 n=1 Tax=Corythoichthys intestinalis TaxID=161448 RepID=UPI0025A512CC|nr:sialic acid-binding Ig-like lectin 14 isoform X2 [Corythoichthys intestinalis]
MNTLTYPVRFFFIFFQVHVEASSWTVAVPSSVNGLIGSCIVIPCSFDYPDPQKDIHEFTGTWWDAENYCTYHPVGSMISQQYQKRTELVGDIKKKDCSLKIDPLQQTDQGPFHFRIEMKNFDQFSYIDETVSIKIIRTSPVSLAVMADTQPPLLIASCTATYSCPTFPPTFLWSHFGQVQYQERPLDQSQRKATSTLTLHPANANNNTHLQCSVTFRGGQQQKATKIINVNYAPENVSVDYDANVKDGASVSLKCSCNANPPASSYEWHNDYGVRLYEGSIFILTNVSRQTGPLHCTAINAVGKGTSPPVQLNVKFLPRPDTKRPLPSSGFIDCVANTTMCSTNATITLPVHNIMLYLYSIIIPAGAVIVLASFLILIIRKLRRSRREFSSAPHQPVECLQTVKATRKNIKDRPAHSSMYTDHIYGNISEAEWTFECGPIYGNV